DLRTANAVVTGGTGGLGRVLCAELARAGVNLVLVYQSSGALAEELSRTLAAEHRVRVTPCQAELATDEGVATIARTARESLGGVDILVNNAAVNRFVPFKDLEALTPELWDTIM